MCEWGCNLQCTWDWNFNHSTNKPMCKMLWTLLFLSVSPTVAVKKCVIFGSVAKYLPPYGLTASASMLRPPLFTLLICVHVAEVCARCWCARCWCVCASGWCARVTVANVCVQVADVHVQQLLMCVCTLLMCTCKQLLMCVCTLLMCTCKQCSSVCTWLMCVCTVLMCASAERLKCNQWFQ